MSVEAVFVGSMGQDLVSTCNKSESFPCVQTYNVCLPVFFTMFSASASESVTFNGGRKKDKQKDPNCLANKIPDGKKVLADSGLKGSEKASTRVAGNSHKMKHFRKRAQGRQESLFKRFKTFGILEQRFRHDYELHKMVLDAVAVIVQYDMENGHPLFDV